VLARTDSYGRTWTALPTPHIEYTEAGDLPNRGVSSVRFVTPLDGYLFGGQLFATSDGGITWNRRRPPGLVEDLEAGAGRAYALVAPCRSFDPCRHTRLYQVLDDGSEFVALGPVGGPGSSLVVHGLNLYLLAQPPQHLRPPSSTTLWTSHDGGVSWLRLRAPCGGLAWTGADLAAWSGLGLALACIGQSSAGSQGKAFYVSTDGGARWQLTDRFSFDAGYVASLAAADRSTWVLGEGRNPWIEISRDGGRTWHPAAFRGSDNDDVEGWGYVGFTDASQAVAVPWTLNGSVLAFTDDQGHTWRQIAFPSGR
jgi:hypothetical protein